MLRLPELWGYERLFLTQASCYASGRTGRSRRDPAGLAMSAARIDAARFSLGDVSMIEPRRWANVRSSGPGLRYGELPDRSVAAGENP